MDFQCLAKANKLELFVPSLEAQPACPEFRAALAGGGWNKAFERTYLNPSEETAILIHRLAAELATGTLNYEELTKLDEPGIVCVFMGALSFVVLAAVNTTEGGIEKKQKKLYDLKKGIKQSIDAFNPPLSGSHSNPRRN